MRIRFLPVSVALNCGLIVAVVWLVNTAEQSVRDATDLAFHGDDVHMGIHAKSLSALRSSDADQVEEMTVLLQSMIKAADEGRTFRQRISQLEDQD